MDWIFERCVTFANSMVWQLPTAGRSSQFAGYLVQLGLGAPRHTTSARPGFKLVSKPVVIGIPVAAGSATGRGQRSVSPQRLASLSADASTLLTSLAFPATSLTWSMAFWLARVPVSATTP